MGKSLVTPSQSWAGGSTVKALIWAVAIAAPGFVIYTTGVESARREAEARVIGEVAAALKTPATRTEDVMGLLEKREKDYTDARYVRAAKRLGIQMDWSSLFSEVSRRDKDEQARAAKVIAEECNLHPGSSLDQEQALLTRTTLPSPIQHKLPIPLPGRASVD